MEPLERLISTIEGALPAHRIADAEEREVKILGVDMAALASRLEELPNTSAFHGTVRTWFFDLPEMAPGHMLRYRQRSGHRPTVDAKGPSIPHPRYKMKREVNWELDGDLAPEDVARIICATLGSVVEKQRDSYTVTDGDMSFHLDLDMDPDLGQIVEIEGATDAVIERAIALLHLEGYATSAEGRMELLRQRNAGAV